MVGLAAAAAVVVYSLWRAPSGVEPLPPVAAALEATTVSGLSSGAFMAGQFHMAHSAFVMGAALVAGGPYGCAESPTARHLPWPASVPQNLARALSRCLGERASVPAADALLARARGLAESGAIDPLEGLAGDRLYLFRGAGDATIGRQAVLAARELYLGAGLPEASVLLVEHPRAGHGFLTEARGTACAASRPPFLNRCGYDMAGALLEQLYGPLEPPVPGPRRGRFVLFDQRPFTAGLAPHGLADTGALYVPEDCRTTPRCGLHVVFHGCAQGREEVGEAFVQDSGFAAHADANRLVILFPQVSSSAANPRGCWDWWGYSSREFHTRSAPQVTAVRRMLERLAASP